MTQGIVRFHKKRIRKRHKRKSALEFGSFCFVLAVIICSFDLALIYNVAKNISHYQESSLNCFQKPPVRLDFSLYKMSITILQVCIKYCKCDLIVTSLLAVFEAAIWIKSM